MTSQPFPLWCALLTSSNEVEAVGRVLGWKAPRGGETLRFVWEPVGADGEPQASCEIGLQGKRIRLGLTLDEAVGGEATEPTSGQRSVVTTDPAVRFGRPQIGGVSTEAIAGMVMAGEGVDTVADEYTLSRHQVLLACWHEGTWGCYRREWGVWAEKVAYPQLAGWQPLDVDAMPEPPDRDTLRAPKTPRGT